MTEDRPGIYIPAEVAEREAVPDELNADLTAEYRFPDPRRRRLAAWIYLGVAVVTAILARQGDAGWWWGAGTAATMSVWHLLAAWPLRIDQEEALRLAGREVDFAVGHASAAVGFSGWRARPQWQVILYSAESPPTTRALVQLDGVTGRPMAEVYTEDL